MPRLRSKRRGTGVFEAVASTAGKPEAWHRPISGFRLHLEGDLDRSVWNRQRRVAPSIREGPQEGRRMAAGMSE